MASIHDRLERIVHQHNVKTTLINNMRNAARERSVTLLRLSITTDPFDLDAGVMEFRQMASDFMTNRDRLYAMPLDPRELALLDESQELTRRAVEVEERVLDKLLAGDTEPDSHWLLEQAIPMQGQVLTNLDAILQLQREAGVAAVEQTAAR